MKLNFYSVSDEYIKFLMQYENKIYDNKEEIRTHTRKYIGIVLSINGFNYYIPMSSPKKSDYINYEEKIIRNDTKTIIRIKDKNRLYGTLRISNMIPVPITELQPYNITSEKDKKYKTLMLSELRYIDKNTNKIVKFAQTVYSQKINSLDVGYIKNTVNFPLLEKKCREWEEELEREYLSNYKKNNLNADEDLDM